MKKYEFEAYEYSTIDEINCMEREGAVVKILGIVSRLTKPVTRKNVDGSFRAKASAVFVDEQGEVIETTEFSAAKSYLRLKEGLYKRFEILGKVVKAQASNSDVCTTKLKILKIKDGGSPFSRMQPSSEDASLIRAFIEDMKTEIDSGNKWALMEAIREAVIEETGIIGVGVDPIYDDGLSAVICQAFSGGKVDNRFNAKIHILNVGPPGSGKKLLWESAVVLNSINEEAQAGRVSVPGLAGGLAQDKRALVPKIGKIPKAHNGVFGFQDFDKCRNGRELQQIMSRVMEDGNCILTGMESCTVEAITALYIDVNRHSDIVGSFQNRSIVEEIGLSMDVLSRIDFISESMKDPKLQAAKASMRFLHNQAIKPKSRIGQFCVNNGMELRRFLRLLIAYVYDEYDAINLDEISSYVDEKFHQIYLMNEDQISYLKWLASFQMRLVNSVVKMVNSFTRMQLTDVANKEAADKAFHLLYRKVQFLKNIMPALYIPPYQERGENALGRWLMEKYGNAEFSRQKAYKAYLKDGEPCGKVTRTVFKGWISGWAQKSAGKNWILRQEVKRVLAAQRTPKVVSKNRPPKSHVSTKRHVITGG